MPNVHHPLQGEYTTSYNEGISKVIYLFGEGNELIPSLEGKINKCI